MWAGKNHNDGSSRFILNVDIGTPDCTDSHITYRSRVRYLLKVCRKPHIKLKLLVGVVHVLLEVGKKQRSRSIHVWCVPVKTKRAELVMLLLLLPWFRVTFQFIMHRWQKNACSAANSA